MLRISCLYERIRSVAARSQALLIAACILYASPSILAQSPPLINASVHNGDNRDVSLCVSSCFDAVVSYQTPAYFSMDTPRSVTLLYRSAHAKPMPVVQVDVKDNSATAPDMFSIRLKRLDNSFVTFTNGSSQIYFTGSLDSTRLGVQFDASSLASGSYLYTIEVRAHRGAGSLLRTQAVRVFIVNEQASRFGAGWSIAGWQRIIRNGGYVTIIDGDGSAKLFQPQSCPYGSTTCWYYAPKGDYSALKIRYFVNNKTGVVYDSVYQRRWPDSTIANYRDDGLLTSVLDRFGNTTSFAYDASHRLQTITDPAGKIITFGYNASGKLSTISDPGSPSRVSTFTINANGDLTHIQDPGGLYSLQATYDANHRMKLRTDRRGGLWGFAYDLAGKLAADTMPTVTADGSLMRPVMRFGSLEQAVLVDPTSGFGTSTNPAPRVDNVMVRASVTNARGAVTRFRLDRWGSAMRTEEPHGRIGVVARDDSGRVIQTISPGGDTTDIAWAKNNVTQRRNRTVGDTVTMTYEPLHNQLATISGHADSVWQYWSNGRMDSMRVGRSSKAPTRFWYDIRGRDTLVKDPEGHEVRTTFAASGWLNRDSVRTGVPSGYRRTAFTYDSYGRPLTIKDPRSLITTVSFDVLNRVTRVIGPGTDPDTTTLGYDALFQTSVTDAMGQQYRFFPNALGWVESDSMPVPPGVNSGRSYSYDAIGNRKTMVNRRGQSVTFTYDSLDHLLTRTADGLTTYFKTDPLGSFVAASNAESVDTLKLDRAGRPVAEIAIRGTTRYERASSFNTRGLRTLLRMVSPWEDTIRYVYTSAMELDSIIDFAGGKTRRTYDNHRFPTGVVLPNGVSISSSYPSVHTPSGFVYSGANSVELNATVGVKYGFNSLGKVKDRLVAAIDDEGVEFSYDDQGRLKTRREFTLESSGRCEDTPEGQMCPQSHKIYGNTTSYTYDKVGNRTDNSAVTAWGNRLIKFGSDSLVYDADGNLVKRFSSGSEVQRLYWNSVGHLVAVWTAGSDSLTLAYDGWGRRVRKASVTSSSQFIHDRDDLLVEVDGSGTRVAEYTMYPGIDQPHHVRRGGPAGANYYFAKEIPGNVVGLMDETGDLVKFYRYSEWGGLTFENGSASNSLLFAAREFDAESGLYFVRARYYDPSIGRFISEDPTGLQGGINAFSYGSDDPINHRDPTGLDWKCDKQLKKIKDANGETHEVEVISCTWTAGGTMSFGDVLRLIDAMTLITYNKGDSFTLGGFSFTALENGVQVRRGKIGEETWFGLVGEVRVHIDWMSDAFINMAAMNMTTGHFAALGRMNWPVFLNTPAVIDGNLYTSSLGIKWGLMPRIPLK